MTVRTPSFCICARGDVWELLDLVAALIFDPWMHPLTHRRDIGCLLSVSNADLRMVELTFLLDSVGK